MAAERNVDKTDDKAAIAARFKLAMRRLPGPVALITTCDPDEQRPVGMVASAVIPVSMDPPSMLVAINQMTVTHEVISRAQRFCINLLQTGQTEFVTLFSDSARREERFSSEQWHYVDGLPYLAGASANLFCHVGQTLVFGTHEMFVGQVDAVKGNGAEAGEPLSWIEGGFARLDRLL